MTTDDKKRVEEIRELNADDWFIDNPNYETKEAVEFLLTQVDEAHAALRECLKAMCRVGMDRAGFDQAVIPARKALGEDK